MLFTKICTVLAFIARAQSTPITADAVEMSGPTHKGWINGTVSGLYTTEHGLVKRTQHRYTDLPDGNRCELTVSSGDHTQGWHTLDFAHLYYRAAGALLDSIARNNRVQVGLTMDYTDSSGRYHQVDCEVTNTGHAYVSLSGARQNVDQALHAVQQLAEDDWTGLSGTSRTTLLVYFGNVVALSIAVNVLN